MAKVKSAASTFFVSLVVLGLMFVGSTSLAIVFYLQAQKAEADKDAANIKLNTNMTSADESLPAVLEARTAATAEGGKITVFGALAQTVTKRDNELKVATAKLKEKESEVKDATADTDKKAKEIAALKTAMETLRAETKAKVAAAETAAEQEKLASAKAKDEAQQKIANVDADIKRAQETLAKAIEAHQAALLEKDTLGAAKEKDLAAAKDEASRLLNQIRTLHRPVSVDVATPVAHVTQVLPGGEVVLDLGAKDRVRPGLTFEVFQSDKVIHMEAGNIVAGKATIEVYTVGEHDAVARLVRGKNVRLAKGDALVNLAFHPQNELNFTVYGVFDINNTHNPNGELEDESRIKALISGAGAKVLEFDTNDPKAVLSPTVDYLVLGAEPKAPAELSDDDKTDVAKVEANKRAQRNYAIYHALLAQARQMQVPVLNQNRFLELIGFYHRNLVQRSADKQ